MASTFSFIVILSLVFRATFSLPVSQDVKTVQLSNSENQLIENTSVLDTETILNLEEKMKHVQGLNTETVLNVFEGVEADHGKRMKRDNIKAMCHCPDDTINIGGRCLPKEKYGEDYDEEPDCAEAYKSER